MGANESEDRSWGSSIAEYAEYTEEEKAGRNILWQEN